jgi:hypothetical protein
LPTGNWIWFGSGDVVHFDYKGSGTQDIRSISVQAFQRLWNRNNPGDTIAEDGEYGTNTESRLQRSPSTGFPKGATCAATTPTAPSCTADGVAGVCMDTSQCTGTSTAGLCPGAANIQCCTKSGNALLKFLYLFPVTPPATACSTSSGVSGTCMYTDQCAAAGKTSVSGACPGANNYQCCVAKSGSSDSSQHVNTAGT